MLAKFVNLFTLPTADAELKEPFLFLSFKVFLSREEGGFLEDEFIFENV